jgi:uncharacterized protein YfaS (alpha-2-macroglobulin family)
MRRALGLLLAVIVCHVLAPQVATQSASLRVVSAGPTGEINQLQDANEIRIIFSEPMVALGRVPSNPTPPWIRITPAIAGTYRWSGTTVLIFTPDPSRPLPYSSRYTVSVDRTATSDAGRTLTAPYEFSFTTPTVKLTSLRWYRRQGRFDQPVVLLLSFNQPVRGVDIAAHTTVRFQPHEFDAPVPSSRERARMASDPAGLAQFNAKVAAARQAAARQDAVAVRLTTDWDRERFPPADTLVALETVSAPPPGTWLELSLDASTTGSQGTVPPAQPQRSVAELAPVFFARDFGCTSACNPSGYNGVNFTTSVSVERFAKALSVRDITVPAREQTVARSATVRSPDYDESWSPSLEDAGYDRQPPARTYAYRLDPSLESTDGQRLGYPWIGIVENWHERAFTSFGDGHGVWESAGGATLPFYSRNFSTVTQWLTRLPLGDLVPRLVDLEKNNFTALPPGAGAGRKLNVTPDATQSYGLDLTNALTSGRGLVWAGVRPGEPIARSERTVPVDQADRSTIVQVTNLGITVKDSPQSSLIFVTRLDNGEPVPGAAVSVINTANRQIWRGTTGTDGVAMAPALPLRNPDSWYELSFVVTAEKDGDVAYLASNWNEGILPWDFGHSYQLWESTDILRGSVFTDRGVYRPGETMHVKAIVRTDTPNGVRLMPAGSVLDIRVRDARNREVDRRTVTLNRWSAAEWSWTVPADATLGNYSVRAMIPGTERPEGNDVSAPQRPQGEWLKQVSGGFLVAAYRRPDFRVDATLSASAPTAGATLTGTVQARYLFGGSMGARPVRWSITRTLEYGVPAAISERFPEDRYAFGYYPDRPSMTERIAGADVTLDATGALTVSTPTGTPVDVPYRYTLEGDVEDVSRQHIANRASTVIHPAPWYIGLRRPDYFADPATGTSVDVVAVDLAGTPVAGVPVMLSLTRVQWNSVRRAEGGGFYTWDTEEVRTPAGAWTVNSATEPVTAKIPVLEGGYYVLAATARDADGRSTRTEVSFYGTGRGYTAWERYDHNRINLEPEKKTWKPGETARLMIQSPWETATALLTVEREGVRRYQRFSLTSTQQTVEVPLTEDDIPNVYVSVLLVRGRTSNDPGADGSDPGKPAFRLGYAELKVEDATRRLTVDVRADRAEYRPANAARVSVAVTDAASRPAASEVTLWAVDYGVLSLTGYQAPDVLGSVYRDKSLQVTNEDSRQRIVSRRVLTPKGDGEGGGGGADDGAGAFRRDFRPLAFWLGSVETDATGRATREVTLPESLTTYRIMAVAGDSSSRFGSANAEIKVTKPVTLLTAFPRFLTVGDRASFGAVVTNTLPTGGRATITIASQDAAQVRFPGPSTRTVEIAPGASQLVTFDASALAIGTARVRMSVTLGGESDAFEATLPVSAPTRMETTAAFGDTTSRTSERITMPAGVLPALGGLNVSLSSSALVGLGEGARYLVNYPYACAEQKSSAALALLLASDVGDAFSMGRIAPAEYRTRATSLLKDLERYQCADGGFGFWPGNCRHGSVYLTSYVLHVMQVAARLGVPTIPEEARQNALNFLEAQLKRDTPPGQVQWQPVWSASNAFSVKVLAESGRNQDSNITRLVGMADRLPIFALSYLADALHASRARDGRYDEVVRRLTNAVRVEGDRAHVEELDSDALRWLWNSNVRATALVLDGFVRRGDNPSLVPGLVRWLLAARTRGRWGNTQENATALESLVSYYKAFETEVPNMTATVSIGSRPAGTATFQGRSSASRDIQIAMPDLLRQVPAGADRELAVSREGAGRLYYTARLDYALADPPGPANLGMQVERRYERFVENGESTPGVSFSAGDLIRVTLTITVPQERRYVAVTDALPGGVEPVDSFFRTTATDLARDASVENPGSEPSWWWERGGFDHVEKFDDRVTLFATRLANGRHQFSYLVRATTAGTFRAAGTIAEEMYAPEVNGRAAATVLEIK